MGWVRTLFRVFSLPGERFGLTRLLSSRERKRLGSDKSDPSRNAREGGGVYTRTFVLVRAGEREERGRVARKRERQGGGIQQAA